VEGSAREGGVAPGIPARGEGPSCTRRASLRITTMRRIALVLGLSLLLASEALAQVSEPTNFDADRFRMPLDRQGLPCDSPDASPLLVAHDGGEDGVPLCSAAQLLPGVEDAALGRAQTGVREPCDLLDGAPLEDVEDEGDPLARGNRFQMTVESADPFALVGPRGSRAEGLRLLRLVL